MGEPKIESLVDTNYLIEKYGFERKFWAKARGKGLPFYEFSPREIRYRLSKVEKWLSEREKNAKAK
jgi:hypothetical protein